MLTAGFILARTAGSHFVYKRAGTLELVDIQPRGKDAKPYQVRQVVDLIQKYEIAIQ